MKKFIGYSILVLMFGFIMFGLPAIFIDSPICFMASGIVIGSVLAITVLVILAIYLIS